MSLIGAFAVGGFITNLVGAARNQRYIILPITGSNGTPQTDANGNVLYQALDGYVTVIEEHHDEMVITDHPVEQGATISDHAYRQPSRLRMRLAWSAGMGGSPFSVSIGGITLPTLAGLFGSLTDDDGGDFLRSVYAQVLDVMANRELLTILTGKREYANMLIHEVDERTTQETEHSLILELGFREVVIVKTTTLVVDRTALSDPATALPTQQRGQVSLTTGTGYNQAASPVAQ